MVAQEASVAVRLAGLAASLREQAAAKLDSGTSHQNYTRRRGEMMARMERDADRLVRVASVLEALAGAWASGTLPVELRGVKTRAVVETLLDYGTWPVAVWNDAARLRLSKVGITPSSYMAARAGVLALVEGLPPEEIARRELERQVKSLVGRIPGFFPTPPAVVAQMLDLAEVRAGMDVLEPSAGSGAIADALQGCGVRILDVVEINGTLADLLRAKGYAVWQGDFLQWVGDRGGYDAIVMNPPFERGQDIAHVQHAYGMLKVGGVLVSVMGEGAFFREGSYAADFRGWLYGLGGYDVPLEAGAFKESGTGVAARLVVLDRSRLL